MTQTADAIIIGTGVIGAATAFELAKKGMKTLSVDRTRMAGQGSTAGSCAIIRMHYSTFDGTAFAWEGYHYWRDWADHLGLDAGHELAKFIECGCMVMKTEQNGYLAKHIENSRALDIPLEEWGPQEIRNRLPVFDLDRFFPVKRQDEPGFGEPTGGALEGAVFWPNGGYVTDPALSAQNLMDAAQLHGATIRMGVEVTDILKEGGRVKGPEAGGRRGTARARRHQRGRSGLGLSQPDGRRDGRDDHRHPPASAGSRPCSRARGFRL